VYPNPAKDKLFVRCEADLETQLSITDLSGRLVYEQTFHFQKTKTEVQITTASFPKGVYLLRISDAKGNEQSIRFAKE
jgi:hypothetical protein